MPSLRLRRALAVAALTAAFAMFPLSDLRAAPRSESRWQGPELARAHRVVRESFSFWNVLVSVWEKAGLRIDDNG
jgi:hypothetical protein